MAMGILMARHGLTESEASVALARASRGSTLPAQVIAEHVIRASEVDAAILARLRRSAAEGSGLE